MKDSGVKWIGEIPEDWEVEKGKHVLQLLSKPVQDTDEVITCFRDGEVVLRSERRTEGFTMSDKEIGYQHIDKGDIVIHGMDGFAGSMGISKSTGKGSPVLIVCNAYKDDPKYLMYYLRILAHTNVFLSLSTGIRERSCDLKWNKISVLPFLLPPHATQTSISAYLDAKCAELDELEKLENTMITELQKYKQSVITETVTQGLNKSAKLKDSGVEWIGMIPEEWGLIRLKYLCTIETGNKDTQDSENEGQYNFYVRSPKIEHSNSWTFEGEGILMAGDGAGAGRVFHHAFGKYAVHQRVYRLANFNNIDTNYLFYYISSLFGKVMDMGSAQSTVPSVRLPMLTNFSVCLPPLSEQVAISTYLDEKTSEIDRLIKLKEIKIQELKEYKKSLIYEYVTGKRKV